MTLRCIFHVSPTSTRSTQEVRPRAPSLVDVDVEFDVSDDQPVRGRAHETWSRARGWASED